MKWLICILIGLYPGNSSAQISVSPGEVIDSSHFNSLQDQVTSLKAILKNKKIKKEYILWTGSQYIDASTSYNLWSSSAHKTWDSIELYIAYDNGSNPKVFKIELGPSYIYGNTALAYQTLIKSYSGVYRRLVIKNNGIDVVNGAGSSVFYLRRVVGIVDTKID